MITIKEEIMTIPTYLLGDSEYLPLFLEKRAYQGSSGKVYPYRVTDQLLDKKEDKEYKAVVLENDFIKVVILPELGGRIQIAYDKVKDRNFIYHNQVIKPALVGLTGPWISGGIEFNWPQHHRPSTFEPVEYLLEHAEDGSVAVYLNELERMNGLHQNLCVRLYPDKNYIELQGKIYNTSSLPQTFLWWANPALKAGDGHQSIFPPDVTAVYDHGKRDVSRFPIATGEYYKADYSAGVDISRYKNIPVPTSYMAWKSDYNFVGAYVHDEDGGLLHVANHHIAPGKKQWTWGHGNFGVVWDRNLTDEDGPYIELMTGVYTDNQPDFTWLDPYEEKEFTQYFMPYRNLGTVQNVSNRLALKCVLLQNKKQLELGLLSFGQEEVKVKVYVKGNILCQEELRLDPTQIWEKSIDVNCEIQDIHMRVEDGANQLVLEYRGSSWKIEEMPNPATSPQLPKDIPHEDELFFIGQHIEQYRNPSLDASSYYLEIIKRDNKNYRANLAMGRMALRSFMYETALEHFNIALKRQNIYNTNPVDGEGSYLQGLALFHLGNMNKAMKSFYKSAWSQNYKATSLYYIATIHCRKQEWTEALSLIEQSLNEQGKNWNAQALRVYILRNMGETDRASECITYILKQQPLQMIALLEKALLENQGAAGKGPEEWAALLRKDYHNISSVAFQYVMWGDYALADEIISMVPDNSDVMQYYAQAYIASLLGVPFQDILKKAEQCDDFTHFPNRAGDYEILRFAISHNAQSKANYLLGNLLYDRKRYDEAYECWNILTGHAPSIRNCSIYLFNKKKDISSALKKIKEAVELCKGDYNLRMIFEYAYLMRISKRTAEERNTILQQYEHIITQRDDLLIEWMQMQILLENYEQVLQQISEHEFHPWEGGEGKVADCYVSASIGLAVKVCGQDNYELAIDILEKSRTYPENINEGKLINRTDNDILYVLGCVQQKAKKQEHAKKTWQLATLGSSEISTTSYYNDTPLDYIFYQAMAHRKLGDDIMANRLCYKLIDFGERNLDAPLRTDFFAVSMPDFNVYEIDQKQEFKEKCLFALMLGFYGMNDVKKYNQFRDMLIQENPNHRGAVLLIDMLGSLSIRD